ncbi:hypothetical protein EON64_02275 [archaeon]|nr:MAG: hypothetical protein EON64_02275 [archaeon]
MKCLSIQAFFDESMLDDLAFSGCASPSTFNANIPTVTPQKRSASDLDGRTTGPAVVCPVRHAFRRKARIMYVLCICSSVFCIIVPNIHIYFLYRIQDAVVPVAT